MPDVNVNCPHCGEVSMNPPLELITVGDEEQRYAVTCPECGEKFRVGPITGGYDYGPEGQPRQS